VAVDAFLHGGVTHAPELDDFAVAVGEHVDLLGLALHVDSAEHHDDVVVGEETLGAGNSQRGCKPYRPDSQPCNAMAPRIEAATGSRFTDPQGRGQSGTQSESNGCRAPTLDSLTHVV
jgi:hypothetical protein